MHSQLCILTSYFNCYFLMLLNEAFIVNFSPCMYLFIVNISGHE